MKWPRIDLTRLWRRGGMTEEEFRKRRQALIRRTPPPTFWLLGKTGSGKSSVIRFLTGAEDVEIGSGFRPTTTRTFEYAFPDAETPLLRFLDTRGLGEVDYSSPEEDLRAISERAHAVIVTQKLLDFAVEPIRDPLAEIRRAAPDRPVLLALTCLHEAYPRQQHPPYPFAHSSGTDGIAEPVARAIARQRESFGGLFDALVPIDLTRAEEGYHITDYGGDHLRQQLVELLPSAYGRALRSASELAKSLLDLHERRAMPVVYGSAAMAAAASLSPIPWVDLPFLIAIQAHMVRSIARAYGQEGTSQQVLQMLSASSAGFVVRMGSRELLKFIPFVGTVTGSVLGAALGYSYTYGLGRACCWYYGALRRGHHPGREELDEIFRDRWHEGWKVWDAVRQNDRRESSP